MIEFDCCDCGIHVVAIIPEKAPEPPLCAMCLFVPGWFEDPQLVAMIDPRRPWPWPISKMGSET